MNLAFLASLFDSYYKIGESMKTLHSTSKPCGNNTLLFLSIVIGFLLVLELQVLPSRASGAFVRPGARNLIFTHNNSSKHEPQQVHVSMVGEEHMKVSWITESSLAPSTVEYGTEPGKYVGSVTGHHLHYQYFFYTSGKIHHTTIGPLKPATTYYYRCSKAGAEFSFRTPPSTLPVEFVVVGDLGQTEWTKSSLDHVAEADYDVFLLPGDLSYADSLQPLWDSFGRLVEPYASVRPWMTVEGNHEVEAIPILHGKGFTAYNARWPMAYEASGSTSNLYYSFDVAGGAVHVIMLGSYADYDAESDQYKWLEGDLARVDRARTPWVFVALHAPWYNSNAAHKGEGEAMRKAMEEMLYRARVDVVFAGHVHAYERFGRVYDNAADPCGPVYITIGDGGNREGLAMTFEEPSPPISLYREPSFGHGRLKVMDENKAHWSWRRNNDTNAFVADEVVLQSLSSSSHCMPHPQSKEEL